jgi:uncharacterized protein (DUF1501 family)
MIMRHTRRTLLKGAAALGLGSQALAWNGPTEDAKKRSVVLIFLRGGADFLNMIVPLTDPSYAISRPNIAIDKDDAVGLNRQWGLHPALSVLKPIYDEGLLVPIIGTGSPHPTRSHFDAEDFMNYAAPGSRTMVSGWMNRYLSATANPEAETQSEFRGIGMQRLLPTSVRGEYPVLAVPDGFGSKRASSVLDRFGKFYGADDEPEESEGDPMEDRPKEKGDVDVLKSGRITVKSLRRFREIVSSRGGDDHGYPSTRLGDGMERIAQVILSGEGLEMAAIDYGGWDHHAGQGGAQGAQANKLRELGGAMAAFRSHLGERAQDTVLMVMTEFGRTVHENGSAGTDHGHGSGMFLMGGDMKSGKVYGKYDGLRTAKLYEARDLPVTTDYRDVIGTVLQGHMGFKVPKEFFPDYRSKNLKLFR